MGEFGAMFSKKKKDKRPTTKKQAVKRASKARKIQKSIAVSKSTAKKTKGVTMKGSLRDDRAKLRSMGIVSKPIPKGRKPKRKASTTSMYAKRRDK